MTRLLLGLEDEIEVVKKLAGKGAGKGAAVSDDDGRPSSDAEDPLLNEKFNMLRHTDVDNYYLENRKPVVTKQQLESYMKLTIPALENIICNLVRYKFGRVYGLDARAEFNTRENFQPAISKYFDPTAT